MVKSRISAVLPIALACALSLSATQSGEWRTYRNEEQGYEIQYPDGWKVIEAQPRADDAPHWAGEILFPGDHQKVTFLEPEGKAWPGEFVVLVGEHIEGQTLDEWADANFTDVYDESLVTGAEDTSLAGRAARLFSVFGFDHTGIVVAFVHDGKIYEISYTGSNPNDPDLAEHGSIYEHMKQSLELVPSTSAEPFDLGGPCDDGEGSALPDFYAKLREAAKREDHQQMIDLHKRYVRAMCSNHHRWSGLAEAYLDAGRTDMAIQVLHELHRRGVEIKPSTFPYQESLASLIETPEFEQSELGRELTELRSAAARRNEVQRRQLETLEPSERPSGRYVAEGACPFECCSYREWDVLETTPLYDAPFGHVVVGSAVKGNKVKGVTGEVYLRPAPVAVVYDRPPFARGEIVFVLDYVGEGFYRYWKSGQIGEGELWVDDLCLRPSRDCWAEHILPSEERQEPRWWILIETEEGKRGWTDRPEQFGNKDACS
jgi:pentatricopeptide repeat protein